FGTRVFKHGPFGRRHRYLYCRSHTTTLVTRGFSKSYSQAALVPSSKVTHKLPRSPWMNSSTVAAFVSMMHSISSFPAASITAIEVLAWCTSMPIYFSLFIRVLLSVGRQPTPQAYA